MTLRSKEKADAMRLSAMAKEWDDWQRNKSAPNTGQVMPIWNALCDAVGEGADGNGMRAAIDAAVNADTKKGTKK